MYSTVDKIFGKSSTRYGHDAIAPFQTKKELSQPYRTSVYQENFEPSVNQQQTAIINQSNADQIASSDKVTSLNWKVDHVSTYDPKVWGPAFWFTLHTSAIYYPQRASPIVKERMKNRILALPYEVPCEVVLMRL
jgi:hypothetical protein